MKNWFAILIIAGLGFPSMAQTGTYNVIDQNNLKQGHWIYFNRDKKLPDYRDDQKVEEGDYLDDQKNGKWTHYFNNDKIKDVITYVGNRPNGYAIFYYPNGNKREEGIWKNNRWIGEYKYYYENGQIASDWKYNNQGTRTGVQKYYHENGKLMIEGEWTDGKETGVVKEYFENGELKSEKNYQDGKFDAATSKVYERKSPINSTASVKAEPVKDKDPAPANDGGEEVKYKDGVFDGNGMYRLKDRQGRVARQGLFENGFLKEGKVFQYTSDGKLFKTTVYKQGKIVQIINHEEAGR
ncbi:MAG: toxin-antitoxin system YwqK family antitoxin [Bacteroidetes bacterium]|nr:toxin-antitoxin system YwqK family antitoxin [Bacteroidota bacterium]